MVVSPAMVALLVTDNDSNVASPDDASVVALVAPALTTPKVEMPVTSNVPPSVELPSTFNVVSKSTAPVDPNVVVFVAPALTIPKVERPVTPNAPVNVPFTPLTFPDAIKSMALTFPVVDVISLIAVSPVTLFKSSILVLLSPLIKSTRIDGLPAISLIPKANSPAAFVTSKSLLISAILALSALIFQSPAAVVPASA